MDSGALCKNFLYMQSRSRVFKRCLVGGWRDLASSYSIQYG